MKKLGVFTFLLAICLYWAQAQVYYITVSGTVTDINGGAPVANHLVDVAIDSSNFFGYSYFTTVTTDALGQYSAVVPVALLLALPALVLVVWYFVLLVLACCLCFGCYPAFSLSVRGLLDGVG